MYSSDGLSNITLSRLGVTPAVGTVDRRYWGAGKACEIALVQLTVILSVTSSSTWCTKLHWSVEYFD